MKVYHGNIITVDSKNSIYKFLVEDAGKIVYVGDELPNAYANAEKVELGEKALLPSFVDTHQHFASFAIFHSGLNVMDITSNKEMIKAIKAYMDNTDDKSLLAFGASPYSVKERRLINREELDSVCPDRPMMLVKYDGHACVVNTPLLRKLEKKLSKLRGYHPESGEMNQEAFFAVSDYISNSISIPQMIRNMQKAVDYEASKGIGMIHTVSGVGFPLNADITIEKLFAKSVQNGFQIRVFPQSMDTSVATSRKLPRIGGCFECALDGCYGSQDAALIEPYENDKSNHGVLYYTDEKVIEFCKKSNRMGLQIEMHAIGDKAFAQATKALKAALDDFPRDDHRHGIIHACLPTKEGIDICAKYRINLLMQSAFDNWRQEPPEYTESILGKERNSQLNPVKTFLEKGCLVGQGSDAPCTNPDPIDWLYRACNHTNPSQAVGVYEALRMLTYNGCYVTFDEKERGTLEVGKVADMLILSANPYELKPQDLRRLKVEKLILSGEEYKPQSQSLVSVIWNGLNSNQKY